MFVERLSESDAFLCRIELHEMSNNKWKGASASVISEDCASLAIITIQAAVLPETNDKKRESIALKLPIKSLENWLLELCECNVLESTNDDARDLFGALLKSYVDKLHIGIHNNATFEAFETMKCIMGYIQASGNMQLLTNEVINAPTKGRAKWRIEMCAMVKSELKNKNNDRLWRIIKERNY